MRWSFYYDFEIYIAGIFCCKKSQGFGKIAGMPVKIVSHSTNVTPFSFFSWVFVNPSLTKPRPGR